MQTFEITIIFTLVVNLAAVVHMKARAVSRFFVQFLFTIDSSGILVASQDCIGISADLYNFLSSTNISDQRACLFPHLQGAV